MPKAGVEPARGVAPLDFESSASSSSATSARSMRGTSYRDGVAGRAPRRHNPALTKERPSLVSQDGARSKPLPSGARQAERRRRVSGERGGAVKRSTSWAVLVLLISAIALLAAGCGGGGSSGTTGGTGGGGESKTVKIVSDLPLQGSSASQT